MGAVGDSDEPLIDENVVLPVGSSYQDDSSVFQGGTGMPLSTWVRRLKRRGLDNLLSQFESICETEVEWRLSQTTAVCARYQHLNRYQSVLLYDASRVLLIDQLGHDYIHASRVDGYKHKSAYIVCQAPLPNTIVDFWRMVWQEQSVLIVMVTSMVEDGRRKCHVYFPTSSDEDLLTGPFRLSLKRFQRRSCGDILLLTIHCLLTNERRSVMLMIYHDWPDARIPNRPKQFAKFFFLTKKAQMTMMKRVHPNWTGHPLGAPIIVHCSAGVGRSASFVVIDVSLQLLLDVQRANVGTIVRLIRLQRRHAVSNPLQFLFIHWMLLHMAKSFNMFHSTS